MQILNFSIAYGKTAHGLARDFNVSVTEAQQIVDKWYNARKEVKQWQARQCCAAGSCTWRCLGGGAPGSTELSHSHNSRHLACRQRRPVALVTAWLADNAMSFFLTFAG